MPPAGFRNVTVYLNADVGGYIARFGAAAGATRQFGQQLNQVATSGNASVKRLGQAAVVGGVLIEAALLGAGRNAVTFEQKMRNVGTISDDVRKQFGAASDQVLDMSRRFPQNAATLAQGLYDIASSGHAGADGLTILRQASLAASAGLTTTNTAAKGVTAVLNAYGLTAKSAADVSDIMFQTVNLGVLTFEELAANIGDVVGSAAAARVSFDEVGAGLATITLSGISAAEASTSLNRVLQSLIDPSDEMLRVLRELGYQSGIAALEANGLQGVMELLRQATGGNIEQLVKLFPEIRAARGALALMANEGKNAERVFAGITDIEARAGATQKAYNEQQKSTAVQLQLARAALEATAIEITTTFLPAVRGGAGVVQSFAMGVGDLPDGLVSLIGVLAATSGAVLTLGGGYLVLAPRIREAKLLFDQLSASSQTLVRGLRGAAVAAGLVTAALTIGAVVLTSYTNQKRKAREEAESFADAMKREADGIKDATLEYTLSELATRGMITAFQDLDISMRTVTDAVLGDQEAVDALASSLMESLSPAQQTAKVHDLLVEALNGSNSAVGKLKDELSAFGRMAQSEGSAEVLELAKKVGDMSDAASTGRQSLRALTAAEEEVGLGADETRQKMAALDAMYRDSADGVSQLTNRQKEFARALEGFIDPARAFRAANDEWSGSAKRGFGDVGDAAEDALRAQERAMEETVRIRRAALDDQLDAERDAYDERRRLADRELDEQRRALEERQRMIETALDDERDALDDLATERSRAFDDERTQMERRHRQERDLLQQGTDETREQFDARRDELDRQQQAEKDAYEDRKTLATREIEDRRRILEERGEQARQRAEDEKRNAEIAVETVRTQFEDEKRAMDERQEAIKKALDDKDRAEKAQLEEQKETNRQGKESWSDFKDSADMSLAEYTEALRRQIADLRQWQTDLGTIAARVGPEVAQYLLRLGTDAAPIVRQFASSTQAEMQQTAAVIIDAIGHAPERMAPLMELGFAAAVTAAKQGTEATVQSVAAALGAKAADVKVAAAMVGVALIDGIFEGIVKSVEGSRGVFRNWDPSRGLTGPGMMAEGDVVHMRGAGASVRSDPVFVMGEGRGSESYIPHHPAYRGTAVPVFYETARALGFRVVPMADGGYVGHRTPVAVMASAPGAGQAALDYRRLADAMVGALARSGVGKVVLNDHLLASALSPSMRESIRKLDRSQR